MTIPCPACRGTGQVVIFGCMSPPNPCPDCSGTGKRTGNWVQVWGTEAGDREPTCLYSIPAVQWTVDYQLALEQSMKSSGATLKEYRIA